MRKDGWPAMCIHGDKQQKERLGEFKTGSTSILVDYIHRIGNIFGFCLKYFMMIKLGSNFLAIYADYLSCSHTDFVLF